VQSNQAQTRRDWIAYSHNSILFVQSNFRSSIYICRGKFELLYLISHLFNNPFFILQGCGDTEPEMYHGYVLDLTWSL